MILACYGENPDTGRKTGNRVQRFAVGDVDEMVDVIMAMESVPHLNVYVPFHLVRMGLGAGEEGKLNDIAAVLGLVVDQDADTGKEGKLPLPPHYVMESSPGNKQPVYVLYPAMRPEEAYPLAKALQRITKTDAGTGDIAHVWRVPGTLNWPNKAKVERGRSTTPQPIKVVQPGIRNGSRRERDDLREHLGTHFNPDGKSKTESNFESSSDRAGLLGRLKNKVNGFEVVGWFDVASIEKDGADRSRHSCRVILKLLDLGFTEGEVFALMLGTECAKRYESQKQLQDDIVRLKGKKNEDPPDYVDRFNEDHAVALMEGQVDLVREQNGVPHFISPGHFHLWYKNDKTQIGDKYCSTSHAWLAHPLRRQYSCVVFDPRDDNPEHYNLWRGFAVAPDPSKRCDLFLAHVLDNICAGNLEHYNWVIGFLAHMVQKPWEKAGVALVLRGTEGVGKGFFAQTVGELCPQHFVVISHSSQLVGNFNAHFQRAVPVFVDEGFWAGDKAGEGALKHLVTDPELLIEGKRRRRLRWSRNLSRLTHRLE